MKEIKIQKTNRKQIRNPKSEIRNPTVRRGSVLLLVLVVVALFTLSAFTYFDLMFNYRQATDTYGSRVQATAAAESGVEYVVDLLNKTPLEIETDGGIYHNPIFQGFLVVDDEDPRRRARFSVLAPAQVNGILGNVRFGLENESARINLNTLLAVDELQEGTARELLLYLPGMTEYIADAILDWMDEDDLPREFGAEYDSYVGMNPPYVPANAPFQTIEDLLLVQGVTPELLYGADMNRNFLVDPDEVVRQNITMADNSDGTMNRGWSAFFTLHSAEANIRADGTPKIDVNSDDLATLYEDLLLVLDDAQTNFIIAYRQGGLVDEEEEEETGGGRQVGPIDGQEQGQGNQGQGNQGQGNQGQSNQGQGGQGRGGQNEEEDEDDEEDEGEPDIVDAADLPYDSTVLAEATGNQTLTTILDLIGVTVDVTPPDSDEAVRVESPFTEDLADMARYLPILMENVSVNPSATIPGRVNINQAPAAILYGIPGLRIDAADQILANRDLEVTSVQTERAYETWILTEGIVTLDEMKELMPFVTGGGNVYRAQIVGFFDEAGPMKRIEVIIDGTSPGASKMVFMRDLTKLGGGFTPVALGAQTPETAP